MEQERVVWMGGQEAGGHFTEREQVAGELGLLAHPFEEAQAAF